MTTNAGRKAKPSTPQVEARLDKQAIAKATAALDTLASRSTEIAERYADGVPYDRERVVAEARYLMAQSAEAMLEAGKRLIQIKENEPHGEFTQIVTERLGLGLRSSQAMMQAAVKYLSPKLAAKAQSIALLGKSKLFDLMVESDDDLEQIAKGGTVAGLTLTDMERMTRRELQAALAKARHDIEAKDRLLDTKNKKIDALSSFQPSPRAIARTEEQHKQLEELRKQTNGAEVTFIALCNVAAAIEAGDSKPMRAYAQQAVQYLALRLAETIEELGIEVSLAEQLAVRPAWLDALNPERNLAPEA